jgi:hypothetical protein
MRTAASNLPPLREPWRALLATFAGCEFLDETLSHVPEGQRGDYFFSKQSVIAEEKEICSARRQQIAKSHRVFEELAAKYKVSRSDAPLTPEMLYPLANWEDEDRRKLINSLNSVVRGVEDDLSVANGQIASTKRLIRRDDAGGLVILVNEIGGNLLPQHILMRVHALFGQLVDGKSRFDHIDGAILVQLFQGYTAEGRNAFVGYCSNNFRSASVDELGRELATRWSGRQRNPQGLRQGVIPMPDGMRRPVGGIAKLTVRVHPVGW